MRALIAATAMLTIAAAPAFACGTERWAVKTGADRDAAQVQPNAQAATVSALRMIPAPPNPNVRAVNRFPPTETTVFAVAAILKVIKRETDQDYHLVIADPQTGQTMIIESPDPRCAAGSLFCLGDFGGTTDHRRSGSLSPTSNLPITILRH